MLCEDDPLALPASRLNTGPSSPNIVNSLGKKAHGFGDSLPLLVSATGNTTFSCTILLLSSRSVASHLLSLFLICVVMFSPFSCIICSLSPDPPSVFAPISSVVSHLSSIISSFFSHLSSLMFLLSCFFSHLSSLIFLLSFFFSHLSSLIFLLIFLLSSFFSRISCFILILSSFFSHLSSLLSHT